MRFVTKNFLDSLTPNKTIRGLTWLPEGSHVDIFILNLDEGGQFDVEPTLLTSAHVFPVMGTRRDKIALTNHTIRGLQIPGGRVEKGESGVHCARRELREETGITLKDDAHLTLVAVARIFSGGTSNDRYPHPYSLMAFFHCTPDYDDIGDLSAPSTECRGMSILDVEYVLDIPSIGDVEKTMLNHMFQL